MFIDCDPDCLPVSSATIHDMFDELKAVGAREQTLIGLVKEAQSQVSLLITILEGSSS